MRECSAHPLEFSQPPLVTFSLVCGGGLPGACTRCKLLPYKLANRGYLVGVVSSIFFLHGAFAPGGPFSFCY